jgi:eukaryotic-like serine/threonine-protein kinase
MATKCPKCQSDNPDTLKFCGECGTQLIPSSKDIQQEVTETLQTAIRELTTGSTFAGRYQVIEELGKGGMGRVYKVYDQEVQAKMALKLIKPEVSADRNTIDRFRNELKIARDISHKNICRMYDLGKEAGNYFITMEYVSGEDLKSFIRRARQLVVGTAIFIAREVCEGLAEAHRVGVVHRDLKPGNIMIDKEGNAKIMDFGIARSVSVKGITGAGIMIGTPEYMSPEQVEGKEVDQRSDIYSLGIILYEMLTGQVPFEGDTPFTIGVKQKSEIPKDPKSLNVQIPHDLSRLILKCLEKDRERRYQQADELRADLEKIEKGIPTTERPIPKRRTVSSKPITLTVSRKKLFIPLSILAAIAIIAIGLWRFLPQKRVVAAPNIKNSIAVISFENQTGDKNYDYLQKAIPSLLTTSLEQAGIGYVATWERLHDLLRQMGKGDVEVIDGDLGFELCRKEGISSIVMGSFVKAGDVFATDAKVLDVETKRLLKGASSKGKGVDSILETQIDQLTNEICQGKGIFSIKLEAPQKKVMEVTTNSMEAYNYYIRGIEAGRIRNWDIARRCLEKAVQIDPEFAAAYYILAWLHNSLGNTKAQDDAIGKAKVFSAKATEKERLFIEADYALLAEKNPAKHLGILKDIEKRYPKEKQAYWLQGVYFRSVAKDYEKAIEQFNRALELDPDYIDALLGLSVTYIELENYTKAIEVLERYAKLAPLDPNALDTISWVNFLMGDVDQAIAKENEALELKPNFYWSLIDI